MNVAGPAQFMGPQGTTGLIGVLGPDVEDTAGTEANSIAQATSNPNTLLFMNIT